MSEVVCRRCGHPNSEASNYCSSCGFDLHRSFEEATSEHKIVEVHDIDHAEVVVNATFVVKRGVKAGSRYLIGDDVTTIGRHPDSDIFLDDVTVPRRHAEVRRTPDGIQIADVGSLNGTYLNRTRTDAGTLRSGDEVQIGKFKLVFLTDDS